MTIAAHIANFDKTPRTNESCGISHVSNKDRVVYMVSLVILINYTTGPVVVVYPLL